MSLNDITLLSEHPTLYDVLDLKPDAAPDEIREAYLRTKAAYNKDSVALYTLVSAEETREMLRRIEEAYEVLSNPDRRREYDRHHGLLSFEKEIASQAWPSSHKKIISIDRVPPMDTSATHDDLLVAPSTDFGSGSANADTASEPARRTTSTSFTPDTPTSSPASPFDAKPSAPAARAPLPIDLDIDAEVEWRGPFLRKVREARRISIEEMSGQTKISKTYLQAIEEENYAKLPAPVYLRGFVIQVAKVLKTPHEKVAAGYMAHYNQARPEKRR